MHVKPRILIGLAALAIAASTAFAAAALAEEERVERVKVNLVLDDEGASDRIAIDDLAEMEIGETRTYTSDSGKTVLVTRDEEGWELDIDGKKIRVGDHSAGDGDVFVHRMKKFELGEDGQVKSMVFLSGDDAEKGDVHIVREIGPGGAHAFAFGPHGVHPGLGVEGTIERLKENAKFQSLDAATQQLVLEALRESAPKLRWIQEGDEGSDGKRVIVLDVEEEVAEPDAN